MHLVITTMMDTSIIIIMERNLIITVTVMITMAWVLIRTLRIIT